MGTHQTRGTLRARALLPVALAAAALLAGQAPVAAQGPRPQAGAARPPLVRPGPQRPALPAPTLPPLRPPTDITRQPLIQMFPFQSQAATFKAAQFNYVAAIHHKLVSQYAPRYTLEEFTVRMFSWTSLVFIDGRGWVREAQVGRIIDQRGRFDSPQTRQRVTPLLKKIFRSEDLTLRAQAAAHLLFDIFVADNPSWPRIPGPVTRHPLLGYSTVPAPGSTPAETARVIGDFYTSRTLWAPPGWPPTRPVGEYIPAVHGAIARAPDGALWGVGLPRGWEKGLKTNLPYEQTLGGSLVLPTSMLQFLQERLSLSQKQMVLWKQGQLQSLSQRGAPQQWASIAAALQQQTKAQLQQALQDTRPEVRWLALQVAAQRQMVSEVELVGLLSDPSPPVAQAARLALVMRNNGMDFGPLPSASRWDRLQAVARWNEWLVQRNGGR